MTPITVTKDNFQKEVIDSDKPVLVDFWAPWCGPCEMMTPVLEQIAQDHSEIKVAKISIDENQDLAEDHAIMTIPTLMLFENGEVTKKSVGLVSKEKIKGMF